MHPPTRLTHLYDLFLETIREKERNEEMQKQTYLPVPCHMVRIDTNRVYFSRTSALPVQKVTLVECVQRGHRIALSS